MPDAPAMGGRVLTGVATILGQGHITWMNIDLLVRGQSNAFYFWYDTAAEQVRREVQDDLGLDGTTDRIIVTASPDTFVPGEPFVCPKADCPFGVDPWMRGAHGPRWAAGKQEKTFLRYVSKEHVKLKTSVTVTLWLHNESDIYDRYITASAWAEAVRTDAALTRAVLHAQPAASPYVFVWIPSAVTPGLGGLPKVVHSAQEIKRGMSLLENDASFYGFAGPQAGDLDMSNDAPGNGYLHMTRNDAASLVHSLANCVANAIRPFARPKSRAAPGVLDCQGPVARRAEFDPGQPTKIAVRFDLAPGADLQKPSAAAAAGAGWLAVSSDTRETVPAQAVRITSPGAVEVSLAKPVSAGWRLYYGYGVGRIALGGGPGAKSGLYDSLGIPMTMPPAGLFLTPIASGGALPEHGVSKPDPNIR